MRLLPLVLACVATAAAAQDFQLRDSDTAVPVEALKARLSGQIISFYDDGKSEFYEDGRYTYTYGGEGGTAYGYWKITADGTVCIDYVNGWSRCDMYVQSGDRLVLITDAGDRFPIRPDG